MNTNLCGFSFVMQFVTISNILNYTGGGFVEEREGVPPCSSLQWSPARCRRRPALRQRPGCTRVVGNGASLCGKSSECAGTSRDLCQRNIPLCPRWRKTLSQRSPAACQDNGPECSSMSEGKKRKRNKNRGVFSGSHVQWASIVHLSMLYHLFRFRLQGQQLRPPSYWPPTLA